jgi:hypothetical protein
MVISQSLQVIANSKQLRSFCICSIKMPRFTGGGIEAETPDGVVQRLAAELQRIARTEAEESYYK